MRAMPRSQDPSESSIVVSPPNGRPYPVRFGVDWDSFVAGTPVRPRRAVVIGDSTTAPLHGGPVAQAWRAAGSETLELDFPAGERSKCRAEKARLEDALFEASIDRDDLLVAVGGGVTTDLVGFVAATYHRGLEWIAVPTSLLAQVDAAIGGKTGLNVPAGKNLVGAIHHPREVWVASSALATLPADEARQGLAEAIKHGWIGAADLFERLEKTLPGGAALAQEDLRAAVAYKAGVVSEQDEDRGKREILNAGHTVAHAIERASENAVPHGRAVAIGLVVEARVAESKSGVSVADRARLERLLLAVDLPVQSDLPFEAIRPFLGADKKTRSGVIRCVLPSAIGAVMRDGDAWSHPVAVEDLRAAWERAPEPA